MALFVAALSVFSLVAGAMNGDLPEAEPCLKEISETAALACLKWADNPKTTAPRRAVALHHLLNIRWQDNAYEDVIKISKRLIVAKAATPADYNKLGNAEYNLGREQDALRDLKQAHVLDPKSDQFASDYAGELHNLKMDKEALQVVEEILKRNPKMPDALRTRSRVRFWQGNYVAALPDIDAAIAGEPMVPSWYYERGKTKAKLLGDAKALDDYAKATTLAPKQATYHIAFADALNSTGKFAEALEEYKKAVEIEPSTENRVAEAECLINMDRYFDAGEVLDLAQKADPKSPYVQTIRGRLAFDQEKYDDASKALQIALNMKPDYPLARYWQAKVLYGQNKRDEALRVFQSLEKVWPQDAQLQDRIGTILTDKERYDDAQKAFDKALKLEPSSQSTRIDRALNEIRMKKWQMAIDDATEIIKNDPDEKLAYIRRGYALWKLDKDNEANARKDFDKAVAIAPKSRLALEERGDFLRLTSHLEEAEADAAASIALGQPTPDSYVLAGQVAEAQEKYDLAEAHYEKAMLLDPKNSWLIENRAWVRIYAHKWLDALADCDSFAAKLSGHPQPYYCRAEVHIAMEQYDKALPDLDKAVLLKKDYWQAVYARGRAHLDLSNHQKAIKDFDTSIAANYHKAESLFYRGTAHEQSGNPLAAAKDFEAALRLADPSWASIVAARLRNLNEGQPHPGRQELPEVQRPRGLGLKLN